MQYYGIAATARASFAFYNTEQEIDALVKAIHTTQELFA
jgi:cysteine desulfurase/selenocysteine lyase